MASNAPIKTLDDRGLAHGGQRFRFVPLRERLSSVSARQSALPPLPPDTNVNVEDTSFSNFADTLAQRRELDLTADFTSYRDAVAPYSSSLPLVYHARARLVSISLNALRPGSQAVESICSCLFALAKDLGPDEFVAYIPRVASTIAELFAKSQDSSEYLWNPDLALVPAFTALARIMKFVSKKLLQDPESAINAFTPLLTHPHYRVREMSAEATAGYLLRKARMEDDLRALLDACLKLPHLDGVGESAVDGVAAVLYEGCRAVNGGLHPYALTIVTHALRETLSLNSDDQALHAVLSSMAALRRNTTCKQSLLDLSLAVLSVGEVFDFNDQSMQSMCLLENFCFLVQRWCRSTGGQVLDIVFWRRALNFAENVIDAHGSSLRVYGDALSILGGAGLASMSSKCASSASLREWTQKAFSSMPTNLSSSAMTVGLTTMRHLVQRGALAFSDICDTYFQLCELVAPSDLTEATAHVILLHNVLNMSDRVHHNRSNFALDKVELNGMKKLTVLELDNLRCVQPVDGDYTRWLLTLEFCRYVPIPDAVDQIHAILNALESQNDESPNDNLRRLIGACALALSSQSTSDKKTCAVQHEKWTVFVDDVLRTVRKFPAELSCIKACDVLLRRSVVDCSEDFRMQLTDVLSVNLSAISTEERLQTAVLLHRMFPTGSCDASRTVLSSDLTALCSCTAGPRGILDDEDVEARVRFAELKRNIENGLDIAVPFDAILHVVSAPLSVEHATVSAELISSIALAVDRRCPFSQSATVRRALFYFTIGIFRTKLKLLWKSAGELWCSIAAVSEDIVWKPTAELLVESGKQLTRPLSKDVASHAEQSGASHGALNSGVSINFETPQDNNNSMSPCALTSSPKHCSAPGLEPSGSSGISSGSRKSSSGDETYKKRVRNKQCLISERWIPRSAVLSAENEREAVCSDSRAVISGRGLSSGPPESLVLHCQLLDVLAGAPAVARAHRRFIIERLYLALDPDLMTRKTGDAVVRSHASLVERLGGLKGCEGSTDLEAKLRSRLLQDLTRSDFRCQAAVINCLCVAKSPGIKLHRDSLLRIVSEATFRDELINITSRLKNSEDNNSDKFSGNRELYDVLVRICFGKLRERRSRMESRRHAVLSFVVSALSWDESIPRLIQLSLAPLKQHIALYGDFAMDDRAHRDSGLQDWLTRVDDLAVPPQNVMHGILQAIDGFIFHFRRAISSEYWRLLSIAVYVVLKLTVCQAAQTVRSLALRILARMMEERTGETWPVAAQVIPALRGGRFDVTNSADVTNAPAFLTFLSACCRVLPESDIAGLCVAERWVFEWAFATLEGCKASASTVMTALHVASGFSRAFKVVHLLKMETDTVDAPVKQGTLSTLLSCLVAVLLKRLDLLDHEVMANGKLGEWHDCFKLTMRVVSDMGHHVVAGVDAEALLAVLMKFVAGESRKLTKVNVDVFNAVTALLRIISRQDHMHETGTSANRRMNTVLDQYCLLLARLLMDRSIASEKNCRDALCAALACFDRKDLTLASTLAKSLGAMRADRVGEPDMDVRIGALSYICHIAKEANRSKSDITFLDKRALHAEVFDGPNMCLLQASPPVHAQHEAVCIMFYSALYASKDADSALRGTAGYALALLAEWCATVCHHSALFDEIFQGLTHEVIACSTVPERRAVSSALGEIVSRASLTEQHVSDNALLCALQVLARPDDKDADFFENIAHIQPHRRSRALRRLTSLLKNSPEDEGPHVCDASLRKSSTQDVTNMSPTGVLSKSLASTLASRFALPLGYHIAMDFSEDSGLKNTKSKSIEAKDQTRMDVRVWAVSACGTAAAFIPVDEYRRTMDRTLRRLARETHEGRLFCLQKLLVAFCDAFPKVSEHSVESSEMYLYLLNVLLPAVLRHCSSSSKLANGAETLHWDRAHSSQWKLRKEMKAADENVYRAPLAIAGGRLMKCLKEEDRDTLLPLLISPLANSLRSRLNDSRDAAKKALVQIVLSLGSRYVQFIVKQVLSVLTDGFRKDSVIYVLHALLLGVKTSIKANDSGIEAAGDGYLRIDSAVDLISCAFADELTNGVNVDDKDFVDPNVSNTKEREASRRAVRVADAAEILGEIMCFSESALAATKPLVNVLAATPSSKLAGRIKITLHKLGDGFVRNRSISPQNAISYIYDLLCCFNVVPNEVSSTDGADSASSSKRGLVPRVDEVTEYGLLFLNSMLARATTAKTDAMWWHSCDQKVLEELMQVTIGSLKSRHDGVVLAALKVSQRLARFSIPEVSKLASHLTETVLEVLSRQNFKNSAKVAPSTYNGEDLSQTCLRAAATMLVEIRRDKDQVASTTSIVRGILLIVREILDGGSAEQMGAALAFVRSVVDAKFAFPEVYDVVDDISRLGIQAHSVSLQATCISISVAFLVNYQLTLKRIRQHLEFFVRNLNYEYPEGRRASLLALQNVFKKFPKRILETECDSMFLPLAASMANDPDLSCREKAADALVLIFRQIAEGRKMAELLKMGSSLIGTEVSCDAVEKEDMDHGTYLEAELSGVKVIVEREASIRTCGLAILTCAAKSGLLSRQQGKEIILMSLALAMQADDLESKIPWDVVHTALSCAEQAFSAMSHKQSASSRLSSDTSKTFTSELMDDLTPFWNGISRFLQHEHNWIRLAACRLLGRHFAALGVPDTLSLKALTLEGLTGVSSIFVAPRGVVRDVVKSHCLILEGSSLPKPLAEQVLKNLIFMTNAVRLHSPFGDAAIEHGELDGEDHDQDETCNRGLRWILHRMSGMACRAAPSDPFSFRRACAMRFLAAILSSWEFEIVQQNLNHFLTPVVLALEMKEVDEVSDSPTNAVMSLAQTMQDILTKRLGPDVYFVRFNEIRSRRTTTRLERKKRTAVEMAVNPEKSAKKRIKRNFMKSQKRKTSRGAHGGKSWRVTRASFPVLDHSEVGALED